MKYSWCSKATLSFKIFCKKRSETLRIPSQAEPGLSEGSRSASTPADQRAVPNAEHMKTSKTAPSALAMDPVLCARLPEGFILRKLESNDQDRQALYEHWVGLDSEALKHRFFYRPGNEFLYQRAYSFDRGPATFIGVFNQEGILMGVSEWAESHPPLEAEVAFSTLPKFRRRGLAKVTAIACALDAKNQGFCALLLEVLPSNKAAQALARSLGGIQNSSSFNGAQDGLSFRMNIDLIIQVLSRWSPSKNPGSEF